MNVFTMLHTRHSAAYTAPAVESFYAKTPQDLIGRFYLIDNDGSFEAAPYSGYAHFEVLRNESELSFAENANQGLALAANWQADLFLLNNDVLFTDGWIVPLLSDLPVIVSPISNQHVQYQLGTLMLRPSMTLEEYGGREHELAQIVDAHRQKRRGYKQVLSNPFFCVKIPFALQQVVGTFDTRFGKGGAEDNDYCLRAYLNGFGVFLAYDSYVLHFQGRSTWRGPESEEDTRRRNETYMRAFGEKWGDRLLSLMLSHRLVPGESAEELLLREGRIAEGLMHIASIEGRGKLCLAGLPKMAAVCCVYDDIRWLRASIQSVYKAVDAIYFLIGSIPWSGGGGSNEATRHELETIPDPENKFKSIFGDWTSEADQRNAGLELLRQDGFEYCLVLDADEIYEPEQVLRLRRYAALKRYVPAWRGTMFTYWKSAEYRIEPPESFKPIILLRVEGARFSDKREAADPRHELIPPEICVCHHMSYARSDEEVLRKITTFSHAHQLVPGWFENVWKGWDADKAMENLNPCWPQSYKRAVAQPPESLPRVLREARGKGE